MCPGVRFSCCKQVLLVLHWWCSPCTPMPRALIRCSLACKGWLCPTIICMLDMGCCYHVNSHGFPSLTLHVHAPPVPHPLIGACNRILYSRGHLVLESKHGWNQNVQFNPQLQLTSRFDAVVVLHTWAETAATMCWPRCCFCDADQQIATYFTGRQY